MEKYEKMLESKRLVCEQQENTALAVIRQMLKNGEQVTVKALAERTGFSRSFFYHNEKIRAELDRAKAKQAGKDFHMVRKSAANKALEQENRLLREEEEKLRCKIADLEAENERIKKALNAARVKNLKEI